jgi:hypothetical protein
MIGALSILLIMGFNRYTIKKTELGFKAFKVISSVN